MAKSINLLNSQYSTDQIYRANKEITVPWEIRPKIKQKDWHEKQDNKLSIYTNSLIIELVGHL